MTTQTENLTAIPGPAVARIVRKELRQAFPGIRFRVSGRTQASWHVLQGELFIGWTDGPREAKVMDFLEKYKGVRVCEDQYGNSYSVATGNGDGTYYAVGSIDTNRWLSDSVHDVINAKMIAVSGAKDLKDLERNFHTFDREAIFKAFLNPDIDTHTSYVSNYGDALRFALSHDDHPIFRG